jgi:RimJ/RimL family protein N-acetyltransferase
MILNNQTINLRAIEVSDLELIQRWRNMQSIQPFVREYREMSFINVENWYNSIVNNREFIFFIIEDQKKLPIGVAGLTYIDWLNKHADLHLGLYEKSWGDESYGKATVNMMLNHGFNFLNLNKIYAEIYSIDDAKLKLFSNSNFKQDAILREHYYFKGKYRDSHIFSILKSEFKL